MATARGHEGLLTVSDTSAASVDQTSHLIYHIVNTATRVNAVTLNVNDPDQDATGFASTAPVSMTYRRDGLYDWSGSFSAFYPKAAPASGHLGQVTFTQATTNKVESWSIAMTCEEFDDTGMGDDVEAREFQPGLWSATGSYRARQDSGTAGVMKGAVGNAIFRLTTAGTDNTLSCGITITSVSKPIAIGGQVFLDYSFRATGPVTSAGTNTLFPTGAITQPELTEVSIRSTGSRTDSGLCFLTGLNASVAIGQSITVDATFRGTGELTSA